MKIEMDKALSEFLELEIKASNTPAFICDEMRVEKIGIHAELEKVLNWWRTDAWIPPEMRQEPRPKCPFCEVLRSSERVFEFCEVISYEPNLYRIIVNNKWVFPRHCLVVASECSEHLVTAERIKLLCTLAKHCPSRMLYLSSRGLGIPWHFHGHIVKSNYVPPLVRAYFAGQHFTSLVGNVKHSVSEIRYHPWKQWPTTAQERYIAGWAIRAPDTYLADTLIKVATICSEEIALIANQQADQQKAGLNTDLFWGPRVETGGQEFVRTAFVFPRRADSGGHKGRLGATEFVGLFAFNHGKYFWYSADEAVKDLRETGLPWEYKERAKISGRIRDELQLA